MVMVCGTDFTASAAEAERVAGALAAREGAPLVLVHVCRREAGDADRAKASLESEAGELHHLFPALHVDARVRRGVAYRVLAELGQREALSPADHEAAAGMVVVSSRGQNRTHALGSVARLTAETSPVPVLVVRDARPLLAWLVGERPLRVLIGVDFSADSSAALRWAGALGRLGPCDLAAAHVTWPSRELRRQGVSRVINATLHFGQLEPMLRKELSAWMSRHGLGHVPSAICMAPSARAAGRSLARLAAEQHADLLVMGSRHLHGARLVWHGSAAREALRAASMSVACVPGERGRSEA